MLHKLKINHNYHQDIEDGIKTFEVRKKDRVYKVGDILRLVSISGLGLQYETEVKVIYILDNPEYCKEGYVILGIELY